MNELAYLACFKFSRMQPFKVEIITGNLRYIMYGWKQVYLIRECIVHIHSKQKSRTWTYLPWIPPTSDLLIVFDPCNAI